MTKPLRLFTSHWKSSLLRDVDATIIGISRGTPKFRTGYRYKVLRELAPSDATWGIEDPDEWRASYEQQLEDLGAEEILAWLNEIGGGRACILLCWERDPTNPETPCHRRYLANFLRARAQVEVPELAPGDLPQREDAIQRSLF